MSSTKRDLETSEEEEQQPKVEKKQKTANKNEEAVFQIGNFTFLIDLLFEYFY